MEEYFTREMITIERELTRLKTSGQKSGASAKLVSKTIAVSANLQYEDISWPTGSARATVIYEIDTGYNSLITATLDWYYGDVTQAANVEFTTRKIVLKPVVLSNGNRGISLYFIGTEKGDDSDAARTKRGETVTVNVNLTVNATNNFTIQEYVQ